MAVKRTSLFLDTDLIKEAATVLGTTRTTDTVRSALERAVREAHIENLLAWEIPDSAVDELAEQRRHREFGH